MTHIRTIWKAYTFVRQASEPTIFSRVAVYPVPTSFLGCLCALQVQRGEVHLTERHSEDHLGLVRVVATLEARATPRVVRRLLAQHVRLFGQIGEISQTYTTRISSVLRLRREYVQNKTI